MHRSKHALTRFYVIANLAIAAHLTAAPAATDTDQSKLQLAYAKARMTTDAFARGDYQTVAELTYPKVVELMGGRDKEIAFIRDSVKQSKSEGISLRQVRLEKPQKLAGSEGHLFCIIPQTLTLSVTEGASTRPSHQVTRPSYLLAISDDDGTSWTFIDGAGATPARIKQLFPHFPEDLKFPDAQKTVQTALLTSKDGRLELKLPEGWEKEESDSPVIQIEAYNEAMGATLIVSTAQKSDYTSFAKYAASVQKGAQGSLKSAQSADPAERHIGGHHAVQWELTGTTDNGLRMGFIVTAVETDTRFNTVFASCFLSRFRPQKDELAKLAGGLTEIAGKPRPIGKDKASPAPAE